MRIWLIVLVALVSLGWGAPAHAHGKSVSHSVVRVQGASIDVWLKLAAIDVSALFAARGSVDLETWAPDRLRVRRDGRECRPTAERALQRGGTPGFVALTWTLRCDRDTGPVTVTNAMLTVEIPSHVHFTEVQFGEFSAPRVLSGGDDTTEVQEPQVAPSFWSAVPRAVVLGARHVMGGWDHLVFLAALVLLTRRLKRLAVALTGFTIGHALSLSATTFGAITLDAGAVEAAIALSIVVVAAENVWRLERARDARLLVGVGVGLAVLVLGSALLRPSTGVALAGLLMAAGCLLLATARDASPAPRGIVATAFGVVHGLGFAGALSHSTFSEEQRLASLLGFNLGVELAQLALAALLVATLAVVARPRRETLIAQVGSATALALGAYWLVQRAIGGA